LPEHQLMTFRPHCSTHLLPRLGHGIAQTPLAGYATLAQPGNKTILFGIPIEKRRARIVA